jgi:hypothetical protein
LLARYPPSCIQGRVTSITLASFKSLSSHARRQIRLRLTRAVSRPSAASFSPPSSGVLTRVSDFNAFGELVTLSLLCYCVGCVHLQVSEHAAPTHPPTPKTALTQLPLTRRRIPRSTPPQRHLHPPRPLARLLQRLLHPVLRPLATIRPHSLPQHHQRPTQRHLRSRIQRLQHRHVPRALRPLRLTRLHEQLLDRTEPRQPRFLGPRVR